jgi:hypothetical protein
MTDARMVISKRNGSTLTRPEKERSLSRGRDVDALDVKATEIDH